MGNEKYYDYYMTDAETRQQLSEEYNRTVADERDALLKQLAADTGCIAWRFFSSLGAGDYIGDLVYPIDHEIVGMKHIKTVDTQWHEKQKVACVRGKRNSKVGNAFNVPIDECNKKLKTLPKYTQWLIQKLGVMRTGLGGPSPRGFGTSMLQTYGGHAAGVIVVAIPNDKSERHGEIEILIA